MEYSALQQTAGTAAGHLGKVPIAPITAISALEAEAQSLASRCLHSAVRNGRLQFAHSLAQSINPLLNNYVAAVASISVNDLRAIVPSLTLRPDTATVHYNVTALHAALLSKSARFECGQPQPPAVNGAPLTNAGVTDSRLQSVDGYALGDKRPLAWDAPDLPQVDGQPAKRTAVGAPSDLSTSAGMGLPAPVSMPGRPFDGPFNPSSSSLTGGFPGQPGAAGARGAQLPFGGPGRAAGHVNGIGNNGDDEDVEIVSSGAEAVSNGFSGVGGLAGTGRAAAQLNGRAQAPQAQAPVAKSGPLVGNKFKPPARLHPPLHGAAAGAKPGLGVPGRPQGTNVQFGNGGLGAAARAGPGGLYDDDDDQCGAGARAPAGAGAGAGAGSFQSGFSVANQERLAKGQAPMARTTAPGAAKTTGVGASGLVKRAGGPATANAPAGKKGEDLALAEAQQEAALRKLGRPSMGQLYRGDDMYEPVQLLPDHLQNIPLDLCIAFESELYRGDDVAWEDIAGLQDVKDLIYDTIYMPLFMPEISTGLLESAKGILLFGPPGTGKTLIAKAAASKSGAKFFSVSASSITSRWHGEGEKNVRALFATAIEYAPSIIFMDEIDSLLTQRTDRDDNTASKIKTEFLIQMDGANRKSGPDAPRLLVIGATNRPDTLDEAARRRFTKRILIPLPDLESRVQVIVSLLNKHAVKGGQVTLSPSDIERVARDCEGYSAQDMTEVCKQAAISARKRTVNRRMGGAPGGLSNPAMHSAMQGLKLADLDPITPDDLRKAARAQKKSVSEADVARHEKFDKEFGWHGDAADASQSQASNMEQDA